MPVHRPATAVNTARRLRPTASTTGATAWTPNQQAARQRIVEAAADLIARDGLGACTVRGLAAETGLKKSTVHSYFDDVNEIVDLAVTEVFDRLARRASAAVDRAPDAAEALSYLVRLFMGRAGAPTFRDGALWPEYIAHAWKRGAREDILRGHEVMRVVFEQALRKTPEISDAEAVERSASVHHYLLGAMIRNMVRRLPKDEVARAVSALSGIELDPARC